MSQYKNHGYIVTAILLAYDGTRRFVNLTLGVWTDENGKLVS